MAELSPEDFARLQSSLMDIKTEKYELQDKCSRLEAELNGLKKVHEITDKNLAKCTKVIAKSKKAKEVQAMVEKYENEVDELKTQNKGLMANLAEMADELDRAKKGGATESPDAVATRSGLEAKLAEVEDARNVAVNKLEMERTSFQEKITQLTQERDEAEAKYIRLLSGPSAADEGDRSEAAAPAADDTSCENPPGDSAAGQEEVDSLRQRQKELQAHVLLTEKRLKASTEVDDPRALVSMAR
jgi:predicted  nucleic acid-binding Zn-ribbon protein